MIDGEGSVGVCLSSNGEDSKRYYPRISIFNTHLGAIQRLHELLPGAFSYRKNVGQLSPSGNGHSCKPFAAWTYSGRKAITFAALVAPLLVIKRDRAELLVHHAPGRPYIPTDIALQIKRLNEIGYVA